MTGLLLDFIALPVLCALATPFVLLYALFTGGQYRERLRRAYNVILEAWGRVPSA